jgi:thiamine transport system ATP-binding protein
VIIELESVSVEIDGRRLLDRVSMNAQDGERIVLLGPSGSGKSTLLRVIAGLRSPTGGRVLLDGRDATHVPTHRRGVGLVFQDGALFPHRDVGANVAYGLELARVTPSERARRVAEAMELVGMPGAERRRVDTLSGGETQRVALARALAPRPRALLLDEPLASLDAPLRDRLQTELRSLFDVLRLTVVHVTHDVAEAFALGDRVAVLRSGALAQVASPAELWRAPADDWVARFLGMRNVATAGGRARVVRPDAVRLAPGDDGLVSRLEPLGATTRVHVRLGDGAMLEAIVPTLDAPADGARVAVTIDPAGVIDVPVFSSGT